LVLICGIMYKLIRMKITIYTTEKCVSCQKVKEYLKKRELPYREIQLEDNGPGIEKMKMLTDGGTSVPVIQIKNVLVGHHPRKLDKLIELLENW